MLLSSYWHLTSQLLNLFVYYFCRCDSIVCLFFFFIFQSHFVGVNFFFSEKWHAIPPSRLPHACFMFYNEITLRREIGAHLWHTCTFDIHIHKKEIFILCEKRVKSNVLTFIQMVMWCDLQVKNRQNRRICSTEFEVRQQQLCLSSILIPNCVHSDWGSAVNKLKTKSFQLLN